MTLKSIIFFALNLVYLVHSSEQNDLCPCDVKQRESDVLLWKFLKTLSVDVPENEKELYSVYPGQLSPLVECNCQINRKKRNLDKPAPAQEASEMKARVKKSLRQKGGCPLGLTLFYHLCVPEDIIDNYYDY